MDNHEFEDLGKKIQDIVDNAVNSNSYHELSHTINQTVNKAIDSGSEALKNAMNSVFEPGSDPQFRKRSYTYQSPYYGMESMISYDPNYRASLWKNHR